MFFCIIGGGQIRIRMQLDGIKMELESLNSRVPILQISLLILSEFK